MNVTKPLVKAILEHPSAYKWSIQGFGMLRTHLDDKTEWRLNIWDDRYRVQNVSMIHDHPWDFESLIIVGTMVNTRFVLGAGREFEHGIITPGPLGGQIIPKGRVLLGEKRSEFHSEGSIYRQDADEIHISNPTNGTVTLNRRTRKGEDLARIFWPVGERWFSAIPREATKEEIMDITRAALERF